MTNPPQAKRSAEQILDDDDLKAKREAVERAEAFISHGLPTCDHCRELSPVERPSRGEFWPEEPITYLNNDASAAVEFFALTVCEHHDHEADVPDAATHRVRFRMSAAEDHLLNSVYRRDAVEVTDL